MKITTSTITRTKKGTLVVKRTCIVGLILSGLILGGCAGNPPTQNTYQGYSMPTWNGTSSQVDIAQNQQCHEKIYEIAKADQNRIAATVFMLDGIFDILDWIFGNGDYKSVCNR